MSNIEKIDPNFQIGTTLGRDDLHFYNVEQAPFSVHGLMREDDQFVRMPKKIAETVNGGVGVLYVHTAGGRVRFATDADAIAISVTYGEISRMSHFALTGSAGFDLYADGRYVKTFRPGWDVEGHFESILPIPGERTMRQITLEFPTYSGVKSLLVGLPEGARLEAAAPYRHTLPIVYYGSSITQGGCVSRPGNTYQAILARELDTDYVNLGFSGNAKGEAEMARYIASLNMSVFVMDYDHNAPNAEHLKATHEPFVRIIREAQPNLPVIFVSRPTAYLSEEEIRMREVIRTTWLHAVANGDTHVDFIDGSTLFTGRGGDSCTVDACHPNDLGFMAMANGILPALRRWIEVSEAKA